MKLLLRRDQRSGMLGSKPVFSIDVRAEISDEDRAAIKKYKLGETVLYATHEIVGGSGLLGAASRLAIKAMTISVSVNDLATGKKVECKDIVEMLGVEDQLKEAAKTFKAVLDAAKQFGGEEVVEL
jgi:F420-0:gamma-glutamyl ligase-like protein